MEGECWKTYSERRHLNLLIFLGKHLYRSIYKGKCKMSTRLERLLENAIKCFRETRSPFDGSELLDQNVSLDEVYDLSLSIASAIEFYLNHKEQAVQEATIQVVREELGEEAARVFGLEMKFNRNLRAVTQKTKGGIA